jgi:hypothetical protein
VTELIPEIFVAESPTISPFAFILFVNVARPTTFNPCEMFVSSSSVLPSTSSEPLASIAPANVDAPDTFTSSRLVRPSISTSLLKSAALANVATPATFKLSSSV